MAWIVKNDNVGLSESEALHNGQIIAMYYMKKGRKKESICALLGNMYHESTINPNLYEYAQFRNGRPTPNAGYGLVQWTPYTKLQNWCEQNGLDYTKGESQLARIDYEIENNIQWVSGRAGMGPNMSFKEFRENTQNKTLNELVFAFEINYEYPAYPYNSLPQRQSFAQKCFNQLKFTGFKEGEADDDPKEKFNIENPNTPISERLPEIGNNVRTGLARITNNILEKIEELFTFDLYMLDERNYYSNKRLSIYHVHDNLYQIKPSINFKEMISQGVNGDTPTRIQPDFDIPQHYFGQIDEGSVKERREKIQKIIDEANKYNGYLYSQEQNRDFSTSVLTSQGALQWNWPQSYVGRPAGDCSAFVSTVYRKAIGLEIPSNTWDMRTWAKDNKKIIESVKNSRDNLNNLISKAQAGDFILFTTGSAGHVVLVTSESTIRHQTLDGERIGPINGNLASYVKACYDYGHHQIELVRPVNEVKENKFPQLIEGSKKAFLLDYVMNDPSTRVGSYGYSQIRPFTDGIPAGVIDCSAFVLHCFYAGIGLDVGLQGLGYGNTASIANKAKEKGWDVAEGGANIFTQAQPGDIFVYSSEPDYGSGDVSHTGIFIEDNGKLSIKHANYNNGNGTPNIHRVDQYNWSEPYNILIRPFDSKGEVR